MRTHIRAVVVASNETDLVRMLHALAKASCTVETIASGSDAIARILANPPDVILCAADLPDIQGLDVLQAIRSHPNTQFVPFLMVAHRESCRDMRQAMISGANDYLIYPFTEWELIDALAYQLERHEAIRANQRRQVEVIGGSLARSLPHRLLFSAIRLMSQASFLQEKLENTPDISQAVGQMFATAKQVHDITRKFLRYAELFVAAADGQARKSRTTFAKIQLTSVCQAIADRYERAKDLHLDLEDATIAIDDHHLEYLVAELVENAFQHTRFGAQVYVSGKIERISGAFTLVVRDEGDGMAESTLVEANAGLPFEERLYRGSGLGLAIVRRLCELYGATLHVETAAFGGSTVRVTLPLSAEGEGVLQVAAPHSAPSPRQGFQPQATLGAVKYAS